MSVLSGLKHFWEDPAYKICKWLLHYVEPERIPDKMFLKYQYHYIFGKRLNLRHPKSFNEKLQWLKLYDHNPLYTTLVDKYAVKEWVANRIGEQYVIPTFAVYDNTEQIDLSKLPDRFVLKCTHDSGSVVICKDKRTFDFDAAKQILTQGLKNDFYKKHREWPYKNVTKRIIAEELIDDSESNGLIDYKFFCFSGIPRIMYISNDQANHPHTDFFDMSFNTLPIRLKDPNSIVPPPRPHSFDEMKSLASVLSSGIPHVRVDFYISNGHVYFGEMTFFHNGGFTPFKPKEWNTVIGEMISLPKRRL